jgi:small multidrug resistance pump
VLSTPYLYLIVAILAETAATSALKASHEFKNLGPSIVVVAGYAIAFYNLTLVLRTLPLGITYALWSGLGVVLVAIAGAIIYRQIPDPAAMLGMMLIIAGVVIINLFSTTNVGH